MFARKVFLEPISEIIFCRFKPLSEPPIIQSLERVLRFLTYLLLLPKFLRSQDGLDSALQQTYVG